MKGLKDVMMGGDCNVGDGTSSNPVKQFVNTVVMGGREHANILPRINNQGDIQQELHQR